MGREADVVKFRECKNCGSSAIFEDAAGLRKHAQMCRRLNELGLIAPTQDRPRLLDALGNALEE